MKISGSVFALPVRDVLEGLERAVDRGREKSLVVILIGLVVGWWVYVPLHELFHAWGCMVAGGTVQELQIARLYGGDLFAAILPFVTAGGEYAGRLSGFDDGGSDRVYAITVLAPYLLTLFPGVPLLVIASRRAASFLFGCALPWALAPFISLLGDAYELGSILVTQVPPWNEPATSAALRGDDLVLQIQTWMAAPPSPWIGGLLAVSAGTLWAFGTYACGRWLAGLSPGSTFSRLWSNP